MTLETERTENIRTIFKTICQTDVEHVINMMVQAGTGDNHFEALVQAVSAYSRAKWVSGLPIAYITPPPQSEEELGVCDVVFIGLAPLTLEEGCGEAEQPPEGFPLSDERIFESWQDSGALINAGRCTDPHLAE